MKISAITKNVAEESCRKNLFIRLSNSFMSVPQTTNPIEKAASTDKNFIAKPTKMGIESLESFTIFPKEIVNGKTVITA